MAYWVKQDDDGLMVAEVDGHEYKFSQYGSKKTLKRAIELLGVLGEPFCMAIAGNTAASADEQQRELLALVTGKLCSNLSGQKDEVVDLIQNLITDGSVCDNKPILFDTLFRGRTVHMLKVFLAACEAQFGDFFTEGRAFLTSLRPSPSGN